jgi:rod shape-determining protein MreD
MSVILSIPVLGILAAVQSAVVSRMPLNRGTADLVLVVLVALSLQKNFPAAWQWSIVGGLFMDYFSGLPFGIFTASYLAVIAFAVFIRERIWRFSFLMQLLAVLFGTILLHGLSYLTVFLRGGDLPLATILQIVTLPSIFLNFLLSLPVLILSQDILEQIRPTE